MKTKQKITIRLMFLMLAISLVTLVLPISAHAASAAECETSILPSSFCGGSNGDGIWKLLNLIINILTGGVAILAIGGVVYASILYASAGGDSGQIKKAKETLRDIVIGIAAFALMYAFLQYIIPGGAFS